MVTYKSEKSVCHVKDFTRMLGGKWKLPIINALRKNGNIRFGKLHLLTKGISRKVLTQQLRELEADGLLVRTEYNEVPRRVEYALSPSSEKLCPVFHAIEQWNTFS